MSVQKEAENHILSSWKDEQVAKWALNMMPLIEKGNTHSSCPVFALSLEKGLNVEVGGENCLRDFLKSPKIVMSGGFEGTKEHMIAILEMQEVRILTDSERLVVIMLEPDSYISERKGREPILDIEQRSDLWATSGLVDVVVMLPEKVKDISTKDHYSQIHQHIQPAVWCANIENPDYQQIIMRGGLRHISFHRAFVHKPEAHASFLHSTMDLNAEELKEALFEYSLEIAKKTSSYQLSRTLTPEQMAGIIYDRLIQEL